MYMTLLISTGHCIFLFISVILKLFNGPCIFHPFILPLCFVFVFFFFLPWVMQLTMGRDYNSKVDQKVKEEMMCLN